MPAGLPYFAWVDAGETVFGSEHMRWDENVFSFTCEQSEGDPANLTVVVRRPRNVSGDPIGLLGPGRKIWAWFAIDCGPSLFRFRGRLVGVPTSIFEELVTLEFVARPFDIVAQKEALAATLRVLPYYDEVVLDEARRTDPEVVLEGYSKIWHYNRETPATGALTISDEIIGEDGLVEFDGASEDGKVLYDGVGLTLTSGPLARVDIVAEYTWTQQAFGGVDLTQYLTSNWPNEPPAPASGSNTKRDVKPGNITSFTLTSEQWPKNGVGLGTGWEVAEATAEAVYDLEVKTVSEGGSITMQNSGGGSSSVTASGTIATVATPPGSILFPEILVSFSSSASYAHDEVGTYGSGSSASSTVVPAILPLHHTRPALRATYTADRPFTEVVTLSMTADVQHILTDPEDGEALRIDDIKSVNLSEPIGGVVPIGDPGRRSYISTARGNQSVEHLVALARAHLLKRARVVEIAFAPKLARMAEITLRKNAFIIEPRIGEAEGKVIGYKVALDGADGRINCEVRIGCTIGRGGTAVAAGGNPTYCVAAYTGADYQQYTGRTILFDTSVGYQPPNADPNDDGLDFMSQLTAADVIDTPLVVENPPATQRAYIQAHKPPPGFSDISQEQFFLGESDEERNEARQAQLKARSDAVNNALKEVETRVTFKLKSMEREFSTPYTIQVTDLKIPTGYDLEAV